MAFARVASGPPSEPKCPTRPDAALECSFEAVPSRMRRARRADGGLDVSLSGWAWRGGSPPCPIGTDRCALELVHCATRPGPGMKRGTSSRHAYHGAAPEHGPRLRASQGAVTSAHHTADGMPFAARALPRVTAISTRCGLVRDLSGLPRQDLRPLGYACSRADDSGMAVPVRIDDGDAIRCEHGRRHCIVRTRKWEVPVQVIECDDGIHIVGISHESVPPHLIVDYRQLARAG